MADALTNFQVRQKDVAKLERLLPANGMKKADRLAVLIRGFEMLGPDQRFAAVYGTPSTPADHAQPALATA